jgi:hypothetical protein
MCSSLCFVCPPQVYNEATSKVKIEYEVNKAAYEQQKLAQAKDAEEVSIDHTVYLRSYLGSSVSL